MKDMIRAFERVSSAQTLDDLLTIWRKHSPAWERKLSPGDYRTLQQLAEHRGRALIRSEHGAVAA